MKKIYFFLILIIILLVPFNADCIVILESARIKGEVVEIYETPRPDESVLVPELRKNCVAKIKIIEIVSLPTSGRPYSILHDKDKNEVVPVHNLVTKEPLLKNQRFIADLHYDIVEHHKYGYTTCEVTLEIKEILRDKITK